MKKCILCKEEIKEAEDYAVVNYMIYYYDAFEKMKGYKEIKEVCYIHRRCFETIIKDGKLY